MKILVVEDTKYMRTVLHDFLHDAGHKDIITVPSAEESFNILGIANRCLDIRPLDVGCILMDIAMPGINGIDACRRIKTFD